MRFVPAADMARFGTTAAAAPAMSAHSALSTAACCAAYFAKTAGKADRNPARQREVPQTSTPPVGHEDVKTVCDLHDAGLRNSFHVAGAAESPHHSAAALYFAKAGPASTAPGLPAEPDADKR
jgi:hypothetical protein